MKILSPAFEQNEKIPPEYTCDGQDISPPLVFRNVSEEAKSLVLIVEDSDAPAGTWIHWTIWDMPPDTRELVAGEEPPAGVQGVTSFGRTGYGGPCPPSGTHRYFFKLFALDIQLQLPPETEAAELEAAMRDHILDKAGLIGVYERRQ